MKADQPNFLFITHISKGRKEGEWQSAKTRINPFHITSYTETFLLNYEGHEFKKMVGIFVSSQVFIVDMTIEEVDKMMSEIDRSLTFEE